MFLEKTQRLRFEVFLAAAEHENIRMGDHDGIRKNPIECRAPVFADHIVDPQRHELVPAFAA